jgi:hypothetical protein
MYQLDIKDLFYLTLKDEYRLLKFSVRFDYNYNSIKCPTFILNDINIKACNSCSIDRKEDEYITLQNGMIKEVFKLDKKKMLELYSKLKIEVTESLQYEITYDLKRTKEEKLFINRTFMLINKNSPIMISRDYKLSKEFQSLPFTYQIELMNDISKLST